MISTKNKSIYWKLYKFIFIDLIYRKYFHSKPGLSDDNFSFEDVGPFLKNNGIVVDCDHLKEQQGVTLYYSNHLTWFDPIFICLAHRVPHISLIALSFNRIVFPYFDKSFIPVATKINLQQTNLPLKFTLWITKQIENLSDNEVSKMNRAVASLSAKSLGDNKSVLMFPASVGKNWYDGIGYIISKFNKSYPNKKLHLQPIYLDKITQAEIIFHGWKRLLGFNSKIRVRVNTGERFELSELKKNNLFLSNDKKTQAKLIRSFLENKYNKEFSL